MDKNLFINLFWFDENLHLMISVLIFLFFQWLAQGVGQSILSSRSIFDQKVELGEEFSPSGLSGIQFLGYHEVFKGLVISQYLESFIDL